MNLRPLYPLALGLLLSACGTDGTVKSTPAAPVKAAIRAPVKSPPPRPRVYAAPGLEGVIGAAPDDLLRQFGTARLDVWEGDARKLQFSSTACVLDIYFYPPSAGREPEATYVEARRASDGQEVDRAACVAALRGK
jgi:hypothetical protein